MKREGNKRKKWLGMLVGLMLLVFMVAYGYKEYASAAVSGTITASTLFVRTGPSEQYPKVVASNGTVVYLSRGDSVYVSHSTNGWYYVTASFNGERITGYVSATYVLTNGEVPTAAPTKTPTPTPSPRPTNTPTPKPMNTPTPAAGVLMSGFPRPGTVTASKLNVRDNAEAAATKIAGLERGTSVTIQGVKRNSAGEYWYQISFVLEGVTKNGYVSSAYISVAAPTATPTPTATPLPTATPVPEDVADVVAGDFPRTGRVTASSLNVRRDAGTSKTAITSVTNGTVVSILSAKTDEAGEYWYQISFTQSGVKRTGYVHSKYIAVDKIAPTATPVPTKAPTATPAPTQAPQATATPTPDPSLIGEVITKEDVEQNNAEYYYSAKVTASELNLRKEPTSSSERIMKVAHNTQLLVINETVNGSEVWYRVALKVDGVVVYGYMSANYVALLFTEPVAGVVDSSERLRMRDTASNSGSYVKTKENAIISLKDGDKITIVGEKTTDGTKWFCVSVEKSGTTYTGYVQAAYIRLALMPEATPTPTPTPTVTPTPSVSPKPTATPRPTATPTPTVTPTPTGLPTPKVIKVNGENYPINEAGTLTGYGRCKDEMGVLAVYVAPSEPYEVVKDYRWGIVCVTPEMKLDLYNKYKSKENKTYWHVGFYCDGIRYYGYVQSMWVEVLDEDEAKLLEQGMTGSSDSEFENYLNQQGFPESYKPYLRVLHDKYPEWIFKADHTTLLWEDVIEEESIAGKNLIPNTKGVEWKSLETGAYDWAKDEFVLYDGSTWVTASKDAVEYYMDPRNFLNETNIFMFEVLRYAPKYQNVAGVENILKGTPFYQTKFTYTDEWGRLVTLTYAEAFIKAAEYSGVSPYHLAARVKQEVVTGTSSTSNSVSGTVKGLEGLFNFYNIGAYHSTVAGGAIANGLKYAKNGASNNDALNAASLIPWTDRYRAIVGGAYILGANYINRGQDTIYLQKFNVTESSTYYHQYMANVEAPYAESKKTASAYDSMKDLPIVFSIPVYYDMPATNVKAPEKAYNPNNWLTSLKIYDPEGKELNMTPTFNPKADQTYYLVVEEDDFMVQIEATAASESATIAGTGFYALVPGRGTTVTVAVTAENGDVREYEMIIVHP